MNGSTATESDLATRVNAALETVRPYVLGDGGDVWLVKVEGDVAYVQLLGACGGCPASNLTLKNAIERAVVERVPEIREVAQI